MIECNHPVFWRNSEWELLGSWTVAKMNVGNFKGRYVVRCETCGRFYGAFRRGAERTWPRIPKLRAK
jgi:hypothetical protein